METVDHHGRETAYRHGRRASGPGASLLCVHGSDGTSAVWNAQLTRLDGGRSVTAIDPSGRERSTGPWLTSWAGCSPAR